MSITKRLLIVFLKKQLSLTWRKMLGENFSGEVPYSVNFLKYIFLDFQLYKKAAGRCLWKY